MRLGRGMQRSEGVAVSVEEDLQGYNRFIDRGIGINAPKVRTRDKRFMSFI